jgi:hypothetical protein
MLRFIGTALLLSALLAPAASAQTARNLKPPTRVKAPTNQPFTVIDGKVFDAKLKPGQQLTIATLMPPPGAKHVRVTCDTITITKISYQFHCYHINLIDATRYNFSTGTWVIRRDGTQPGWALKPEDFDLIKTIASKDKYGFETAGNRTVDTYYERQFFTLKDSKAPAKYCSANPLNYNSGARNCYDLMSVTYNAN